MPRACSLFRYSVEKLSTTLSDNLAMSTDLTFVTNEPGNNLRQESAYIFNPREVILSSYLVNAEASRSTIHQI
jgi:hypothetical protein